MATKKDNRRGAVRRARRALNACNDTITRMSGRKINTYGFGRGIDCRAIREDDVTPFDEAVSHYPTETVAFFAELIEKGKGGK